LSAGNAKYIKTDHLTVFKWAIKLLQYLTLLFLMKNNV